MSKKLTLENWLVRDDILDHFVNVGDGTWKPNSNEFYVARFLEPQLVDTVPEDIKNLFEVARGAMVYGVFFYPLFVLGTEQLYRVAEAAAKAKCREIGGPAKKDPDFKDFINHLVKKDVIPQGQAIRWDAFRKLRNSASHPEKQWLHPPGHAASTLRIVAEQINELFLR